MLNQLIIQGRLTKDVELRTTASQKQIAVFTIATDNRKSDETTFVNCIAFEKVGENLTKWCKKGDMICVIGALNQRRYKTKDGEDRSTYEVLVDSVEFLQPKKEEPADPNPEETLPNEEPVEEKPPLAAGWHYDENGKAVKDIPSKKNAPKK